LRAKADSVELVNSNNTVINSEVLRFVNEECVVKLDQLTGLPPSAMVTRSGVIVC